MRKALVLCAALLLPSMGQAQFVRETLKIPVLPLTATTFEVIEADAAGGSHIWCAAGLYARKVLGLERGRLWVARGRQSSDLAPGRKGVIFSVEAVPGEFLSPIRSVRRPGLSFSIGHANAICREADWRVRLRSGV